jgi:hypothetical protein
MSDYELAEVDMKFWIIVIVAVALLAMWGWRVDRRRSGRGGQPGDTSEAAGRSRGHDDARGVPGYGSGGH